MRAGRPCRIITYTYRTLLSRSARRVQRLGMTESDSENRDLKDVLDYDNPFDDLSASGLLTESDREFLLGKKSYADPQARRKKRQRLRQRVRNGLLDFVLLSQHLDRRDRIQILADLTAQVPRTEDVYREGQINGMLHAILFLYAASHDVGLPFDDVVETGVVEADQTILPDPYAIQNWEITIESEHELDIESGIEKLRNDESITDEEYYHLKRLLFVDREYLLNETESVKIAVEDRSDNGETLSRGESLIVVGRMWEAQLQFDWEIVREVLHHEVVNDPVFDQLI